MEVVLNLVMVGVIIAIGIIITVANLKTDWKGCVDRGGPGCSCCPFPCEYNRTGEKSSKK